jgi:hypothetical protein
MNQALAREKRRKHSRGMTRADVSTLAWMTPFALLLIFGWRFEANEVRGNFSALVIEVLTTSVVALAGAAIAWLAAMFAIRWRARD